MSPRHPPQKSAGPASVKTGGGGSSSGASSGTSYASVVKGETGPAETAKEEKGTQQKKAESIEKWLAAMDKDDPLREDLESQLEQLRAAFKDPRNPGARLDSAMAKMRKAKAKVQKCEEQLRQGEASLYAAHAEEEEASSELKAAQENAVPKQPELPPGDAAMQLSSENINDLTDMLKQCGLLATAACEDASEAHAKKARTGPYNCPQKTPREIPNKSSFGGKIGKQRQHSAGCGEEWWGWIVGRDTPWGSRGPPRAIPPPTTKPSRPCAANTPPDSARRTNRPQRDSEGHGDTEPAQCADARLNLPREHLTPVHLSACPRAKYEVFRKPSLLKIW